MVATSQGRTASDGTGDTADGATVDSTGDGTDDNPNVSTAGTGGGLGSVVRVALGGLLFGHDTGIISSALSWIEDEFSLSAIASSPALHQSQHR
jgi:hypothetical protein